MKPVILGVSGLSPAIISETFYALAKRSHDPFIAAEVAIITTAKGKEQIHEQLLGKGLFQSMCEANGWQVPLFEFYVIRNGDVELTDVITDTDFNCLANTVLDAVRHYTRNADEYRIHASLAGGRKTMSYYLGQAMNLFGRPDDRLSHVLLKPEYEHGVSNFYYPYQSEPLLNRQGEPSPLSADHDDIMTLSEFPVINIAQSINVHRFINSELGFQDILQAVSDEQSQIMRSIDFTPGHKYNTKRSITLGVDKVNMPPECVSILLWLAWRDRVYDDKKAVVNMSSANAEVMERYYFEFNWIQYYVRNGFESQLAIDDVIPKEHSTVQKKKGYLNPKFSEVNRHLKNVSSVYAIKVKQGQYRLSQQAFKPEAMAAVTEFMNVNTRMLEAERAAE